MIVQGRVWKIGDNIDTDQLLAGRYLSLTDPQALAAHCLEQIFPKFHTQVRPGDILVAGKNFGSGSSREHAPIALKALGISCLIANSYARIFFRNCINLGLPALTSPEATELLQEADEARIDLVSGFIENLTSPGFCQASPLPHILEEILAAGGMTAYVQRRMQSK